MKFGLESISRLCSALDHPEQAFASVIVAGTNGKGSVTAMVHRALVAAGHAAARYTSPHLERIEERYVLGETEVEAGQLRDAIAVVRAAIERLQASGGLAAPPTFFECATAVAFVLFRASGVRIAVLEVGLGGRLDATNVVTPLAAAITSIALDHQEQLGNDLSAIAREKAGVIKPGIPVVCGELPPEAEHVVIAACARHDARFIRAADAVDLDMVLAGAELALPGAHQRGNAMVAACLLREIDARRFRVDEGSIRAGLTAVEWPGRLERMRHGSAEVLLDAAHNPAGARALAAYLHDGGWADSALVFGAMADKDIAGMLAALAPVTAHIICTTAATPRAMDAAVLAAIAARVPHASWTVATIADPAAAIAAATAAFPRVVVAGSIFLIGPVRGILRPR